VTHPGPLEQAGCHAPAAPSRRQAPGTLGSPGGVGGGFSPGSSRICQVPCERQWKRADVLFVSDGEWPVPAALEMAVRSAREAGTRFHGVQIGNSGHTGLHRICDPVHVFADWVAVGAWS
jgi:hypothetical protein